MAPLTIALVPDGVTVAALTSDVVALSGFLLDAELAEEIALLLDRLVMVAFPVKLLRSSSSGVKLYASGPTFDTFEAGPTMI